MNLPPGWIELNLKTKGFQREDLLLVRKSATLCGPSEDWFEVLFMEPAMFDAGDEAAFEGMERTFGAKIDRKPGWLVPMLEEYRKYGGMVWWARGSLTSELIHTVDGLFRRRAILAPSPDVHRELTDRERIELLDLRVAELARRLDAR